MNAVARRLLLTASAGVDRAVVAAVQAGARRPHQGLAASLLAPLAGRRARTGVEALAHEERLEQLAAMRAMYATPELLADPDAFFPAPPPVQARVEVVRDLPWGGRCYHASWPSASEPFEPSVRPRYLAAVANRTAHARLYVRGSGRPFVVVVHGYMAGQFAIEERAWPIRWLQSRGLDVAVAVLPFHGVRAREGGGPPPFPGSDPRVTNEGFRQAVADLRVLVALLRERGAPSVGMMGMSLGGYATSLTATLEPGLSFVTLLIPLASVADFARDQGRLGRGPQADAQHAALEATYRIVSPFARPPRVPPSRVIVVGAEGDRVTPISHAGRLAAHFGAPLLRTEGGHLVQTWRREAFGAFRAMLEREGIAAR